MRKAVLSLTVLMPSKRMTLTLLATCLAGMLALYFGVGIRTAETQTTAASTTTYYKVQDLGDLGGTYATYANGINNSGQVVGSSYTSDGEQHAFLYDSSNGMQDLNDLIPADSGWTIDTATAINSDGKIAAHGYYGNYYGYYGPPGWESVCPNPEVGSYFWAAFVLTPATTATYEVQYLGTLGGDYSKATGINDFGKVVGDSQASDCVDHAFLYDESATPKMQDLGTLGGDWDYSNAWGINDSAQVVGDSDRNDGSIGSRHAFLKESGQPMIDLNILIPADSGWTIEEARAINSAGKIATTGHKDGVGTHTLLLTPTSDPPPDSQAPSAPTVSSPQNNTYDSDGSFSVSGSAEAASTVELFEGTTSKGTTKADSSSGAWSIPLSGVSEGSHTYYAKAKDAAGNTSPASNTVTVTVDKTAPKVNTLTATSVTSTGVPLRKTDFKATFSEKMNTTTLNTSTFKLFKCSSTTSTTCTTQITNVAVTPSGDGLSATLNPFGSKSTSLQAITRYKVVITTGAKDVAGNALDQDSSTTGNQQKVGYFTTGSS
jgi:probable HAF family extracellular repeat protein